MALITPVNSTHIPLKAYLIQAHIPVITSQRIAHIAVIIIPTHIPIMRLTHIPDTEYINKVIYQGPPEDHKIHSDISSFQASSK